MTSATCSSMYCPSSSSLNNLKNHDQVFIHDHDNDDDDGEVDNDDDDGEVDAK